MAENSFPPILLNIHHNEKCLKQNLIKICSVAVVMKHADGEMDEQMDGHKFPIMCGILRIFMSSLDCF
jgi:hypothetical protein